MICDIKCFLVPTSNTSPTALARGTIQCKTHGMTDFAPYNYPGLLCPVGKVEKAVEDGLARISQLVESKLKE